MKQPIVRFLVALIVGVTIASCGTRLPDSRFEATASRVTTADRSDDPSDSVAALADDLPADETTDTSSVGRSDGSPVAGPTDSGVSTQDAKNTASDVGITATTITLGNITAENGVLGDAFAPAVRGMRAWAAAINAAGGIRGRQIILKTCDDRESRERDLACAQRLVEQDKAFALVGTNTRTLGGSAQYLADRKIPVIGIPITNAFYRYPTFFGAYPSGYPRDGKTVGQAGKIYATSGIYRWFKQNLGITQAAVLAYDITESKQAGDNFAKGLQLEGVGVTQYSVSFAAPSFDQAVADMQRRGVQIIFDTMDDGANRKLCDTMQRREFKVKAKVSTVVSMGAAVGNNYNDTCRNSVYVPSQSLPYTQTSNPEIAKFRQAFAKYQGEYPLHQWALEAWILADMVGEYLDGPAPTRAGLVDFLNAKRQYRGPSNVLVGLDWAVQDYTKPSAVDCFTIVRWLDSEGGWVTTPDKFPFCYPDAHQYGGAALDQGN